MLCGGVTALVNAGFETLVEAGDQPEVAYFECLHELKLIVDLMYEGGESWMRYSVSDTAEYGDLTRGPRVIGQASKDAMAKLLADIQSGEFAREWVAEDDAGRPNFQRLRAEAKTAQIEETGKPLRKMIELAERRREGDGRVMGGVSGGEVSACEVSADGSACVGRHSRTSSRTCQVTASTRGRRGREGVPGRRRRPARLRHRLAARPRRPARTWPTARLPDSCWPSRDVDAILLGAVGTPAVPPGVLERGLLLRLRFDWTCTSTCGHPSCGQVSAAQSAGTASRTSISSSSGRTPRACTRAPAARAPGSQFETATEESLNTWAGVRRCVLYAAGLAAGRAAGSRWCTDQRADARRRPGY